MYLISLKLHDTFLHTHNLYLAKFYSDQTFLLHWRLEGTTWLDDSNTCSFTYVFFYIFVFLLLDFDRILVSC